MVILSALQPHRLLAAPPQPLPQYTCSGEGGSMDGSQHGMPYSMSLDDMRSQVAGEEDRCGALRGHGGQDADRSGAQPDCVLRAASALLPPQGHVTAQRLRLQPTATPALIRFSTPPFFLPHRSPYGELRCELAVIRHGDRTPKQKMKM